MREPRRRGSLFSRLARKRKKAGIPPAQSRKSESYSIPACTTWTMLLRTA